jgi:diguanylate cyclase (GGDEF)-like protein
MKVLLADDEALSRRLLESTLRRWGYEVIVAKDGIEASGILESPEAPRLVLLDWLMPGKSGLELCREIRRRETEAYTYVLMLTAKRNKGDVVAGLEAGADDYITKPFEPDELKVRLRTGKRILYLLEQLTLAQDSLRNLATHDSLTTLWNRSAINDKLFQALSHADRRDGMVAVAICDLDYFKRINDTHGHLVGDEVLAAVAKAMRDVVRPYDAIGRYGGEEFLIVLPGCDQVNAVSHAERLRAAVARVAVRTSTGELRVTASFGVTVAGRGSRADVQSLIHAADSALYRAKAKGRDRVEFEPLIEVLATG